MTLLKDRYVNPLTDFGFKKLKCSFKNAKLMRESGEPVEKIVQFTGLTPEDIQNI